MENSIDLHGLCITAQAGFHRMDEAEWSRLRVIADGEGAGFSDPERHMIVTLGFRQAGGFSAALLNVRALAKNMEMQLRRAMAALDYRTETMKQRSIGGKTAEGLRCSYTAQGTGMTGESYVIKDGKQIWYLHVYMRTALLEASVPVWEELLDAATFS